MTRTATASPACASHLGKIAVDNAAKLETAMRRAAGIGMNRNPMLPRSDQCRSYRSVAFGAGLESGRSPTTGLQEQRCEQGDPPDQNNRGEQAAVAFVSADDAVEPG